MDRNRYEWFPALLTAGSFLAMVSTWIVAFLDALVGSFWWRAEFGLCVACALAFVSLLETRGVACDAVDPDDGG
jgi:hypothetical protein